MSFGVAHFAVGLSLIFLGSGSVFAQTGASLGKPSQRMSSLQKTAPLKTTHEKPQRDPFPSRAATADRSESQRHTAERSRVTDLAAEDRSDQQSPDPKSGSPLLAFPGRPFKTAVDKMNDRVAALLASGQTLASTNTPDKVDGAKRDADPDRPTGSVPSTDHRDPAIGKRLAEANATASPESGSGVASSPKRVSNQRVAASPSMSHDIISQAEFETLKSHLRKPIGPLRRAWGTLQATPKGSVPRQSIDRTTSPP